MQAVEFGKLGGMIDFRLVAQSFDTPHRCVIRALRAGVPLIALLFLVMAWWRTQSES